jgi:hypothetical protein
MEVHPKRNDHPQLDKAVLVQPNPMPVSIRQTPEQSNAPKMSRTHQRPCKASCTILEDLILFGTTNAKFGAISAMDLHTLQPFVHPKECFVLP